MKRPSRRISNGFGYIGFGNVSTVFNQSTRKAFTEIKERLDSEAHSKHKVHFLHKQLSKTEKENIKNTIRKAERKRFYQTLSITVIIGLFIAFGIANLIENIMNN
ncbi:hypothetical protein [Pontimicrobium sp. IMCC45349]|uniref:hypothetical protein n=1 Tax=Pontimicrobium sp. IMCC45349 TaxID=3391574 RepID=UPI0039A1853B